jgi:predicted nucleic acid-binding protein
VPKLYIETTIPSFYYKQRPEPEMVARCNWTRQWWDEQITAFEAATSYLVIEELEKGDHPQKAEKLALLKPLPLFAVTPDVIEIAEVYIERFVMPKGDPADAFHLALASYNQCDILLTWNCNHLANYRKFDHIRRVNTLLGLATPALLTPLELLGDSEAS